MLAGVCAGFLPHNFYPARIFMGDCGSMLIGLVLSASAITLTGQYSGADLSQGRDGLAGLPGRRRSCRCCCRSRSSSCRSPTWCWPSYAGPGAGRSPFAPDKQHLHHRLLEIGHSPAPRGADHVDVGRRWWPSATVVVSLYTGPLMWTLLAVATAVTVALTFVLPQVRRPRAAGARASA